MCTYSRNQHLCHHKTIELHTACAYAVSPSSCGRMLVSHRKSIRHLCQDCQKKRAQYQHGKIHSWVRDVSVNTVTTAPIIHTAAAAEEEELHSPIESTVVDDEAQANEDDEQDFSLDHDDDTFKVYSSVLSRRGSDESNVSRGASARSMSDTSI